jgi:hypothetical protein
MMGPREYRRGCKPFLLDNLKINKELWVRNLFIDLVFIQLQK